MDNRRLFDAFKARELLDFLRVNAEMEHFGALLGKRHFGTVRFPLF